MISDTEQAVTVGARVKHIPTGIIGVVVRVVTYGLLVEVGRGDYRVYPREEWVQA